MPSPYYPLRFVVLEESPLTFACIGIGTHDEALSILHKRADELLAAGWKGNPRVLPYTEDLAYLSIEIESPISHQISLMHSEAQRAPAKLRMIRCSFAESLVHPEAPLDVRLKEMTRDETTLTEQTVHASSEHFQADGDKVTQALNRLLLKLGIGTNPCVVCGAKTVSGHEHAPGCELNEALDAAVTYGFPWVKTGPEGSE